METAQISGIISEVIDYYDSRIDELLKYLHSPVYGGDEYIKVDIQNMLCSKHRLNCYRENLVGILSSKMADAKSQEIVDSTNEHFKREQQHILAVGMFPHSFKRKSKTVKKNKRR